MKATILSPCEHGVKVACEPAVPSCCGLGSYTYTLSLGWQAHADMTQDWWLPEVGVTGPQSGYWNAKLIQALPTSATGDVF